MAALSKEAMDQLTPKAPLPGRKVKKAELKPSDEAPRIKMKKKEEMKDEDRPSEKMRKRMEEKEKGKTWAERMSEMNAAIPEGRGKYGAILKGATSGAAAGATLGEALAQLHQEKIQKGHPQEPRTVSGKAMAGGQTPGFTSIDDAQKAFSGPEMQAEFRNKMGELKQKYGKKPKGGENSEQRKDR